MAHKDYRLRALFVDLHSRSAEYAQLSGDTSKTFLGGRGIGAWIMSSCPTLDPLDEQAPLIFAAGPLTGSRIPSSGRMVISGFSPLTDTVCSASVGGKLGLSMKHAGIDLIIVTGRAEKPVVLTIDDRSVRFEQSDIPLDTPLHEVFSRLSSFGGSAAAIGRAAFQGCRYASVMIDGSFASGRGGLGLVMASKNLQALMVRGTGKTAAHDRQREDIARSDIIRLFDASPAIMGGSGIANHGTAALVDLMASRRMMPTANFRKTYFEEYRTFCSARIKERKNPKHYACPGCPIACKQKAQSEIPEFETLSHFGALNENTDLDAIIEANRICNEAGMDTITAASTIACLAEIRNERYTGEALVDKVRQIASCTGDGELLQLGSASLARQMGQPEKSMSVKASSCLPTTRGGHTAWRSPTAPRPGGHATCGHTPSPMRSCASPLSRIGFPSRERPGSSRYPKT